MKVNVNDRLRFPKRRKAVRRHLRTDQLLGILLSILLSLLFAIVIFAAAYVLLPFIKTKAVELMKFSTRQWAITTPVLVELNENLSMKEFEMKFANKQVVVVPSGIPLENRELIKNFLVDEQSSIEINLSPMSEHLGSELYAKFRSQQTCSNSDSCKMSQVNVTLGQYWRIASDKSYDPTVAKAVPISRLPVIMTLVRPPSCLIVNGSLPAPDVEFSSSFHRMGFLDTIPHLNFEKNGSGWSFHHHGESWNDLVVGRKRWLLYPPTRLPHIGFDPLEPLTVWVENEYPRLRQSDMPFEIMQEAGQVVYVPEGWYHSSLVVSERAISVSHESSATEIGTHYYYLREAQRRGAARDYHGAVKLLVSGLGVANDPLLSLLLGELHEILGEVTAAEQSYKVAVGRNYRHPEGYLKLVQLWENAVTNKTSEIVDLLRIGKLVRLSRENPLIAALFDKYDIF